MEYIFNKQCSFDQYLWKNMVEQLIILIKDKNHCQKREFETLKNEYNKIVELLEVQKEENTNLQKMFVSQEKSRVELIEEELIKYKEKVCLFNLKKYQKT